MTYFFNCGREEPYPGEDRILVPSQKVATYDLMPEMSAPGIADALVADIERGRARCRHLQLRQRRHGRAHRQPAGNHRGGGDARPLSGPDPDALRAAGGDRDRHRRPRQRRADVGRRAERAAYGAHVEPGAGDPVRRALSWEAAAERQPAGRGADAAGTSGTGELPGHDGERRCWNSHQLPTTSFQIWTVGSWRLAAGSCYSTSFSCVSSAAMRSERRKRLSLALISKLRRSTARTFLVTVPTF